MDAINAVRPGKKFKGGVAAVGGIDLAVKSGEIFGLPGPNGAGKTTTIRMLATYIFNKTEV